jgi:shikimate dehydrogenase
MRAADVVGLSVTMPHKAEVARLVQERSETAARLEAVNCVLIRDGAFFGANTDGEGFVTSLARGAAFDPAGARCLVIGAGGAARAVVLALAGAGASDVVVLNRTPARAAEAAALAGASGRVSGVDQVADVAQADLVVNATPAGMEGTDQGTPASGWPVDPSLLHQGQVVVDLVYAPRPTAWLKAAAESGATTVDGLGMLVHQAAAQIALWTGLRPPVDAMWQAATRAV